MLSRSIVLTGVAVIHLAWSQQTVLIDSTNDGSFEGTGNAGWTLVDETGAPNHWCIGSARAPSHGSRCAYISDTADCSRHAYRSGVRTRAVHLYKMITIPVGQPFLRLSLKALTRGSEFDKASVYLVPQSNPITGGRLPDATHLLFYITHVSGGYNAYGVSSTNWTPIVYYTCVEPGIYFLVFSWQNSLNFSYNPPIAIDEVSLISYANDPDPLAKPGEGVVSVSGFPYNHAPMPATTCGLGDDLRAFQVKNACSKDYLQSPERLWSFTAPQNGCLEITFVGDTNDPNEAWKWFGLQLFEGNPLTCGRCIASHTTYGSVFRTLRANVISGQKYYLLLDASYSTICGSFLQLHLSLSSIPCAAALPTSSGDRINWSVSPSPAREKVRIHGTLSEVGPVRLQIFSSMGQVVLDTQLPAVMEEFSYEVPLSGWAKGLYLVRLTTVHGSATRAFWVE